MADVKLSALTELATTPADNDEVYIRDESEAAAAESKRITILNLLGTAILKTLADANSVLYAVTNDTPAALAVAASRVVGRKSTGNVVALTGAEVTALLDVASDSAKGVVELAVASEINTGTDATRANTPDALAGSNFGIRYLQAIVFDFATDIAVGDGKMYFHIPPALNGMNLVYCHAEVITAGTTGTMTIQVHELVGAVDMLSTLLQIDTAETGSDTAATPYVINGDNDDVATNDVIRVDVDAVHTTPAKGLIVTLGFQLP